MNDETNGSEKKKGTTVFLEQEAYSIILEKQMEIFKETNKRLSIQELVSQFIKKGSKIEELYKSIGVTDV